MRLSCGYGERCAREAEHVLVERHQQLSGPWTLCLREWKHWDRAERLVGEGHGDLAEQVEAVEHERRFVGKNGIVVCTWKWRCGVLVRPLLPSRPSTWPRRTRWPQAHAYGSRRQVCVEQEEPGRDSHRDVVASQVAERWWRHGLVRWHRIRQSVPSLDDRSIRRRDHRLIETEVAGQKRGRQQMRDVGCRAGTSRSRNGSTRPACRQWPAGCGDDGWD